MLTTCRPHRKFRQEPRSAVHFLSEPLPPNALRQHERRKLPINGPREHEQPSSATSRKSTSDGTEGNIPRQSTVYWWSERLFYHLISNKVIYRINRIKEKNRMVTSVGAEKTFDKIQHAFTIKTLTDLRIEAKCLNLTKNIYENPTTGIIINGLRPNACP